MANDQGREPVPGGTKGIELFVSGGGLNKPVWDALPLLTDSRLHNLPGARGPWICVGFNYYGYGCNLSYLPGKQKLNLLVEIRIPAVQKGRNLGIRQ